jgi:NAD(P)-dependent dehydrogenase (short-subunit alcohol dehydrogenase family)
MRERRSGAIVNVTSVAGRIAAAGMSAYTASKHALEAATEVLAQEVRPFNIRVALVEPGIIATQIFNKAHELAPSAYSGERRINALFAASLNAIQVPSDLVAERIVELLAAADPPLRHPVGPDAEPFLGWRAAMTDEEWVALGGMADDEAYCARIEQDFGLDLRPYMGKLPVGIVTG